VVVFDPETATKVIEHTHRSSRGVWKILSYVSEEGRPVVVSGESAQELHAFDAETDATVFEERWPEGRGVWSLLTFDDAATGSPRLAVGYESGSIRVRWVARRGDDHGPLGVTIMILFASGAVAESRSSYNGPSRRPQRQPCLRARATHLSTAHRAMDVLAAQSLSRRDRRTWELLVDVPVQRSRVRFLECFVDSRQRQCLVGGGTDDANVRVVEASTGEVILTLPGQLGPDNPMGQLMMDIGPRLVSPRRACNVSEEW
jgi:hypothetical protein